jgi:5-oxoprolinase (ATP-hydrolysing) subunit C
MTDTALFEVLKPGLETSVQELPGRLGYWEQGFPPSGPADAWSFRLANLLVGNHRDQAALECQFLGPTLRFLRDGAIALAGADMAAKLDDGPLPLWQTIPVRSGQVLSTGAAKLGARMYIAFAGGIDTPPVLGSRATFHMAGVGGIEGYALKAGQRVPAAPAAAPGVWQVDAAFRPPLTADKLVEVEVMLGPNDDWLGAESVAAFLAAGWSVLAQSNRTGMRLKGPPIAFADRAYDKRPEHGQDPSNILDHGYPVGGINIAGQTPIILLQDAPSTGGFINPFTVPSGALWKLGHARPGQTIRFTAISLAEAQALRRRVDQICTQAALRDA